MWSWTVLDQLVSGQHTKAVTIPEGLTLTQIAKRVEEAGLADADEFLNAAQDRELLDEYGPPTPSFEGFLFPGDLPLRRRSRCTGPSRGHGRGILSASLKLSQKVLHLMS